MKKKRFAALLLFAPLLFTGCGGVASVEFQTNWYRNTSLGDALAGTNEQLEYEVTMSESTPQSGFSVQYTNGVYKTSLVNSTVQMDTRSTEGYVLESTLEMDVSFTLNGQSTEVMHDSVTSHVEFLPVGAHLCPLSSVKTIHCHTPNNGPASLDGCFTEYHYSYAIEYDDRLTTAKVTYSDLMEDAGGNTPEPTVKEVSIEGKGTYLDNEEILFALRGMNFSLSPTFRTYNTTMGSVQSVVLRQSTKEVAESVDFERDGAQFRAEALAAVEVHPGYSNNIGLPRVIVLAKKTSDTNNENRNVPLRIETTILRNLGTLRYTLKKATFTGK